MSSQVVFSGEYRHSCEGRNPDNSATSILDARLRGHDEENTPIPDMFLFDNVKKINDSDVANETVAD